MSLIPYHPREGREIVLRHRNALVVRDTTSQHLEVRSLTECPTCHRPLPRSSSPDRAQRGSFDRSSFAYDSRDLTHDPYVDPEYFRMLQAGHRDFTGDEPPPSPIRRLVRPAPALGGRVVSNASQNEHDEGTAQSEQDSEFLSSTPDVSQGEGGKIRKDSFSQGYFSTFFVEEKILGKGGKGVVLLVRHEIDGCHLGEFACKRVPVGDDHAWLEKVLIEVTLLAKLSHPNLVSYRHVWLENYQTGKFSPVAPYAFILQQYCNHGDLHQYVLGEAPREATKEELKARVRRRSKGQADSPQSPFRKPQLAFEEIYSLFKDIISGVAYLHAANYVHRDLKPSNCLLHREGHNITCLISDFGEVQPENVVRKSTGSTGTISYCAPEVLQMDLVTGRYGNFTTKSDIFSLGMILYFMCFGHLPYRSANVIQEELEDMDDLRDEITSWQGFQDERRERPDLPSKLYVLLQKLLAVNPAERPAASDILAAMRTESSFEGLSRADGGGLTPPPNGLDGLRGGRVQNLDSPAPPSSPAPGKGTRTSLESLGSPERRARRRSSTLPINHQTDSQRQQRRGRTVTSSDGGFWGGPPSHLREETPVPGDNENHSGTLQRRKTRRLSQDTEHPLALTLSQQKYRDSTRDGLGQLSPSRSATHGSPTEALAMPHLLMGPQSRRERLLIQLCQFSSMLLLRHAWLGPLVKFAVFAGKVASLAGPCWPYMPNFQVGLPLMCLAALDFGLTPSSLTLANREVVPRYHSPTPVWGPRTSIALLFLHFAVAWTAGRSDGLCVRVVEQPWSETYTVL